MKLLDIKKALVRIIKNNILGAKVPESDAEEGFEKPSFFIEIVPISKSFQSRGIYKRKLTILIKYITENQRHNEYFAMQDLLEEIFSESIAIGDRVITIDETEGNIIDKVLHFRFDIEYNDSLEDKETEGYELMRELNMKEEY